MPHSSPKRLLLSAIIVIGTFLGVGISAQADPVTIDFEGLTDSTAVTTQYSGLIFINATILTAGVSLNEFEFRLIPARVCYLTKEVGCPSVLGSR
jgi:hypothetical protein